ncbi:Ankyrin repeat-containing protein, putative [Penicillium digitatum]|nr:Ankyrin repeat-containing protein, putative [Penicillium digitatum]
MKQVPPQDPNVLSTVPPGSMENTHSNGGNSQGPETPAMVTDFSVTQMVEDILEHDQGRRGSWTGRGRFQESEFQNLATKPMEKGNTPLHQAASYGQLPIVRLLLARGADRRSVNTLGKTPLHLAAELGDLEMVQTLSNDRSVINMQDKSGSTALHLAAMAGHHGVVQILLDGGADIEARI